MILGITRDRRRRGLMGRRQTLGHNLFNGMVDFWPLSEQSSTRLGVHAGLHITDHNTVTGGDGVGSLASQFTAANTEYLSRASETALQLSASSFSIALWCNPDSSGNGWLIGKWAYENNRREWGILIGTDRYRALVRNSANSGSAEVVANTFGAIAVGSWTFVVVQYDSVGQELLISVNGAENTAAATGGSRVDTSIVSFGCNIRNDGGSAESVYGGRMQRVAFWKRLLTADERAYLYNGGRGRDYPFI